MGIEIKLIVDWNAIELGLEWKYMGIVIKLNGDSNGFSIWRDYSLNPFKGIDYLIHLMELFTKYVYGIVH